MSIPIGEIPRAVTRSVARVAVWHAEWQLRQFLKGLPHCERVQDRFLARILLANQDSDFGRQHGFARMHSYSDFTRAGPCGQIILPRRRQTGRVRLNFAGRQGCPHG